MTPGSRTALARVLDASDAVERLTRLGLAERDVDDAERWSQTLHISEVDAVRVAADRLRARIGDLGPSDGVDLFVDLPAGPAPGLVALLALARAAPEVGAFHAARGVPAAVSTATLADLGRQVAVHRLTYGSFGLHTQGWLTLIWSGALYDLGRLQLALQRDERPDTDGWVLGAHVPRSGPLDPAGVDLALDRAGPFFADHFPELPVTAVVCHSWLLDPDLAAALPGTNLAAFQRRWVPYGEPLPGDADVAFFVFGRRGPVDRSALPADTALRRAVLERWRRGLGWSVVSGRLAAWPR